VTPKLREIDRHMPARPWIDHFSSGYMQREMHRFPKQGDHEPYPQNYGKDKKMIRFAPLEDGALIFSNAAGRTPPADSPAWQASDHGPNPVQPPSAA
jgi:hypothetical protein